MPRVEGADDGANEVVIVNKTDVGNFQVHVAVGSSSFLADEPLSVGGLGSGPNPYDLMCAALGACTVMTIQLYARRKKLALAGIRVSVSHHRSSASARDIFVRKIQLSGTLDEIQRADVLAIANRCPVHLSLERGSEVKTDLLPNTQPSDAPADSAAHVRDMIEVCGD